MPEDKPDEKEAPIKALDEADIAFLKNYGLGPYAGPIKKAEHDIKHTLKRVNDVCGVKESDTGLAPPSRWDLVSDKQMMQVRPLDQTFALPAMPRMSILCILTHAPMAFANATPPATAARVGNAALKLG